MKKIFFYALFSASCLISCSNKKDNENSRFATSIQRVESFKRINSPICEIDYSKVIERPHSEYGNLISTVQYIPLRSKEPIGIIDRIEIYGERIYVLDAFKTESVYIFDLSGSLVNIIHSKGGGPEEYLGLADMSISTSTNEIVLNDRLSLHTLFYSLDGKFRRKVRSMPNFYFEIMNDKWMNDLGFGQSYDEDVNYKLVVSIGDSILRKAFPFYPIQNRASDPRPFSYNYKGDLLFTPTLSDTVYHIINDSLYTPKYVVNQKNSIWEKKDLPLRYDEYSNLVKHSGYTYLTTPILETANYLSYPMCLGYKERSLRQVCWYDKTEKKSFVTGGRKDNAEPIYLIPRPYSIHNGCFVGISTSDEVNNLKDYISQIGNIELIQDENLRTILTSEIDDLEAIVALYSFK